MGKFKIFGALEREGSNCIYKALNSQTNELVCLKRESFVEEGVPSSILREISFMKEMEHTNIVRLLEVVEKERAVYIVMEYMELDLRKFMNTSPEIVKKPKVTKSFLQQILSGLAYCHSHKILHRGLKPESLLLDHSNQGTVKLADFGLARDHSVHAMTYTGDHSMENPWYQPPELLLGDRKYSKAIDVWAVGCIFAEMVTLQPLFVAPTELERVKKIFSLLGKPTEDTWPGVTSLCENLDAFVNVVPKDLAEVFPDLEPQGVDLLRRMLQLNPKDRISASAALKHQYFEDVIPY